MTKFQLLPPLSQSEYDRLEASILHEQTCTIEVDENDDILDGHHRFGICQKHNITPQKVVLTFDNDLEKKAYVIKVNDARRQMSGEQRAELRKMQIKIAKKLNKTGEYTQEQIAGVIGVDQATISRWLGNTNNMQAHNASIDNHQYVDTRIRIEKKEKEAIFQQLEEGLTQEQIAANFKITQQRVSQIKRRYDKEQRVKERVNEEKITSDILIHGDFRNEMRKLPDNSIDLIFTDPPYDKKSISLYCAMAGIAKRKLKPNGSLLCYAGHYALPQLFKIMTPHLRYWWIISLEHSGNSARLPGKWIFVGWKPILWFVKNGRRDNEYIADRFKSSQPEKIEHEWQQDVSEAKYYIEHLTGEGDLIVDPFAGSATTLKAALELNRKCIGYEKDEMRYKNGIIRLSSNGKENYE